MNISAAPTLPDRGITREIMQVLRITDAALALRVESEMSQYLRFSECTRREFNREARTALAVLTELDRIGPRAALAAVTGSAP